MKNKDRDPKFVRNYQHWVMVEGYKDKDDNNQFVLGQVDTYRKYRSVVIKDMLTKHTVTVSYDNLIKYGKRITRRTAYELYELHCENNGCAGAGGAHAFIEAVEKAEPFVYQEKKTRTHKDDVSAGLVEQRRRVEELRLEFNQCCADMERTIHIMFDEVHAKIRGKLNALKRHITTGFACLSEDKPQQTKLKLTAVDMGVTCEGQQNNDEEL